MAAPYPGAVMDQTDHDAITAALRPLLRRIDPPHGGIVVACRANEYTSSSPSLVVTVECRGGRRTLFVKLDRPAADPPPRSRFGVDYSAAVHARLLAAAPWPCPAALGVIDVGSPARRALVMDHLDGCLRVGEAPDESGIVAAAAWCGRFHAWAEPRTAARELAFLVRHDADSYRAWSARAVAIAAAAGAAPAWLARVRDRHDAWAGLLAAGDRTIIHGEFSVPNVLWRDGMIFPVDWESAAVGPGEIDLAALVFGWPANVEQACLAAYRRARGAGPEEGGDAATRFAAAMLHTGLRWLPAPDQPGAERFPAALASLRRAAERVGVV